MSSAITLNITSTSLLLASPFSHKPFSFTSSFNSVCPLWKSSSNSCLRANKLSTLLEKRLHRKRRFWRVNSSSNEKTDGSFIEKCDDEDISKATLIWRAVKLPIYSVALIPLTVGTAASYYQTGIFHTQRYTVLLLASFLIIAWLNLSNDVYDFDTGADRNKKESVVNILGNRSITLFSSYGSLLLGFIGLLWASYEAGDIRSILLLACAITCGYIYQCPPFRLSYQGLGEPLCFTAFGPLATTAFYLSHGRKSDVFHLPLSGTILSSSILVGVTTTLILFCSHFHQIDEDKAVGKMSPLVRMGTEHGSKIVKFAVLAIYFLLLAFSLVKALPLTCLFLCGLTVPMGKLVIDFVEKNHFNKTKIFMAKYYCVRLHALFGAALATGLIVVKSMGRA